MGMTNTDAAYRVVRTLSGTYQIRRNDMSNDLVSNHGRREAEARRKVERLNAAASAAQD